MLDEALGDEEGDVDVDTAGDSDFFDVVAAVGRFFGASACADVIVRGMFARVATVCAS